MYCAVESAMACDTTMNTTYQNTFLQRSQVKGKKSGTNDKNELGMGHESLRFSPSAFDKSVSDDVHKPRDVHA